MNDPSANDHPILDHAKPEKPPFKLPLSLRILCGLISIPVACVAILSPLLFTLSDWRDRLPEGLIVIAISWSAFFLLWWLAGFIRITRQIKP